MDISGRPEEAGSRSRDGNREADTVIGRGHSGAVVTLVDKASKFVFLQRVDRRTAAAVSAAMLEMLRPSAAPVHTITSDNGREFAGHVGVARALRAAFYFATPYHFWERGLNGHTNGLARQYLPKGTDLRAVTDAQVRAVQGRTDARPPPTGADWGAGRGWTGIRRRVRPGSGRAAPSLREWPVLHFGVEVRS